MEVQSELPSIHSTDVLKALGLSAPLFASSLAVCFDVGYFYGIGPHFFTFFTLSEHLVFALQALPYALWPAVFVVLVIFSIWYGELELNKFSEDVNKRYSAMQLSELEAESVKARRSRRRLRLVGYVLKPAIFGFSLWCFYSHQYVTALSVLGAQVIFEIIPYPVRTMSSMRRAALMVFCFLMGWTMAFSLGFEQAEKQLDAGEATEKISSDSGEVAVRVVRGGERGILVVVPGSKRLNFMRWDAVKKIETIAK